jgi:hypothetical protein
MSGIIQGFTPAVTEKNAVEGYGVRGHRAIGLYVTRFAH